MSMPAFRYEDITLTIFTLAYTARKTEISTGPNEADHDRQRSACMLKKIPGEVVCSSA